MDYPTLGWILLVPTAVLSLLLCPPIRYACARKGYLGRKDFKKKVAIYYERLLHFLVLGRQILLFFFPTAFLLVISTLLPIKIEYFLGTFVLGLSILIFVSTQLPLLMRAHLLITFKVDCGKWELGINIKSGKTIYIESAIRNLGFSTYKNSSIIFYFKPDFEIVPYDDILYDDLDFKKEFNIQKRHGGVSFNPKDNFLTIPPQEVFIFPMWVKAPNKEEKRKMTILFSSENTWGMNLIRRQMSLRR